MGVPGYYRYIIKNFPYCIKKNNNFLKQPYLFFDYNGVIHSIVNDLLTVYENINISQDEFIKQVCHGTIEYTDRIIQYIRPQFVYIAMDGVAPRAKMTQQRLRRFKSAKERDISKFDRNCISPGTDFMLTLEQEINIYLANTLPKYVKKTIFSSTANPGEGEHCIMDYIKKECKDKDHQLIIYGLDADLILLSMATLFPKIYLLREVQFFERSYIETLDTKLLQFNFLCIDTLKRSMIKDVEHNYHIRIKNQNSFVKDWVFMSFFLGNDFLPHLKALDIYNNGVQLLLKTYCDFLKKSKQTLNDYLIRPGDTVNMYFLRKIFNKFDKNQENYIIENIKHYKHKRISLNDYPIRYCYKGWKNRYYDYFYKTHSQYYIERVVKDYFKTLMWTKDYYFKGCPCWRHFYKYHGVLFHSMNEFLQNNDLNSIQFEKTEPYTPYQQLMMILPSKSRHILPEELQKMMTDPDSELIEYYPVDFELHTMDKIRDWMYEPILPYINDKLILKYV
jgi:5'-3' exonuclease